MKKFCSYCGSKLASIGFIQSCEICGEHMFDEDTRTYEDICRECEEKGFWLDSEGELHTPEENVFE